MKILKGVKHITVNMAENSYKQWEGNEKKFSKHTSGWKDVEEVFFDICKQGLRFHSAVKNITV